MPDKDKEEVDEFEEELEKDLKEDEETNTTEGIAEKLFSGSSFVKAEDDPEAVAVQKEKTAKPFKKTPTITGSEFEMIMLKMILENTKTTQIIKHLLRSGYQVSDNQIDYYKKFYDGKFAIRMAELKKLHRALLNNNVSSLRMKIGNNPSSLQQLNYYISVLNTEIEIVREYSDNLSLDEREDMLDKLIGRVQNLMALKNKYVSELDKQDNIKKIVLDIVKIASDTLLHSSLDAEQKKILLEQFKTEVRDYVGYIE